MYRIGVSPRRTFDSFSKKKKRIKVEFGLRARGNVQQMTVVTTKVAGTCPLRDDLRVSSTHLSISQ